MIRGLPASIALHGAILAVSYVGWPFLTATRATETEMVTIPVELVDIGEFTNIAAVRKPPPEPEVEEEVVPEEPEEEPEVEEPIEEPDPVDETLPEDEIDTASEQKPAEEEAPEDVVPDLDAEVEEPEPEDKPKPEPEEEKSVVREPDPLDDLLNSADSTFTSERQTRKRQEEPKVEPKPLLQDTPPKPREVRKGAGERTANTARLESLLYNQIYGCWDGIDDQPNPEKLNVRMSIELDQDGNLKGRIKLVEPSREPLGRSPMRVAIERARRAVQKCAPYKLPKQEYAEWKDININLGPAFTPTNK